MEKLLIGIPHDEKNPDPEVTGVVRLLDERKPSKLGLELLTNYPILKATMIFPVFGEIATEAEKRQIQPVYLEEQALVTRFYGLIQALEWLKEPERVTSKLRRNLKRCQGKLQYYNLAEWKANYELEIQICQAGLDVIATNPSEAKIWNLISEGDLQREKVFLERIRQYSPEMVVIGVEHMKRMTKDLSDYKTIEI